MFSVAGSSSRVWVRPRSKPRPRVGSSVIRVSSSTPKFPNGTARVRQSKVPKEHGSSNPGFGPPRVPSYTVSAHADRGRSEGAYRQGTRLVVDRAAGGPDRPAAHETSGTDQGVHPEQDHPAR